jgi:hypothetical protein
VHCFFSSQYFTKFQGGKGCGIPGGRTRYITSWSAKLTSIHSLGLNMCGAFLPLGVASCCVSIQLVPYDTVNRNKVSIRQLPLFFIFLHSLHVSAPTGHPHVRYTIRYLKDYSYYNGSAVRTQLDVCLYWYFDPWSFTSLRCLINHRELFLPFQIPPKFSCATD